MSVPNYYNILSIAPDSNLITIKKAFRREVSIYHPDKNPSPNARTRFELIVEAFDVLSDQEKRKEYNKILLNQASSLPATVSKEQQENIDDWQQTSRKKSKKYRKSTLTELLALDIFLDLALDSAFNGTEDLLDGVFDIF